MVCRKCKSNNISMYQSTYVVSKRRSLLWNLFMTCITGGIWLIWMLVRKQKYKIKRERTATCQYCGYSWKF